MPALFDALRWVLEWGYTGHAAVIRKELVPVRGKVLDCGCGTGIFASHFLASDYTGVDLSEAYIRTACSKFKNHRFEIMNAENLRFADSYFDLCFISGVFHHLDPQTSERVLAEIARVLKQGGRFVVWEDIPSPQPWNFVGHFVHALDKGRYIRKPEEYRRLLDGRFGIEGEYLMRSGFMDYAVFKCVNRKGG